MNVDDDNKEPVTELSLSLDYFNQGTTHLIDNSGAGANATSRVNMAFVASDHLTELVWSPRKGLSVKCTNCSTAAAEESRRMLAVGMGNKATSTNKADKVKGLTTVTSSKSSGRNCRIGIACQSANMPVNEASSRFKSSSSLKNASELFGNPVKSILNVSSRKRSFLTINRAKNLCLHEKTEQPQLCLTSNINEENQQSSSIPEENQKCTTLKKQKLNTDDDTSVFKDNSFQGEDFPTESKINEYQRKGKAKVLSDANVGPVDEKSRGSIESCSSAGSFCSRQRKRTLQEVFSNETKRIKTTVQQSPHPMSLVNGSSSFISWISNMTKGINKANKAGAPCLALTLNPSEPQSEKCEWELVPHPRSNNDKYPRQGMGFHNIFQSIYCTSSKVHTQPVVSAEQMNGETLDACTRDRMADVSPLSMREMTSSSCKGDQSSGNGKRQLKMQRIGTNRELNSSQKVASCDLLTKAHCIKMSASGPSLDEGGTQNNYLSHHAEVNAGLTNVSDPLQSFWITRFCPKSPVPLSVSDKRGQILPIGNQTMFPKNAVIRSSEASKVVQSKEELIQDLNKLVGGKRDGEASDSDPSVGLKEEANFNAQTSDCNIPQKSVTERLKSSAVMASMFARRLDAIKLMTPASMTGNASGVAATCFYCGNKGHSLHNCSEFTENKLEGALDSSEKTPCLCFQCFQLGHQASVCPTTQVTVCEPLAIPISEFMEKPGAISSIELLVENKHMPMAGIPSTPCNQNNPNPDSKLHKAYSESAPSKLELEESAAMPLPNSVGGRSSDNFRGYFDAVRLLRLSRREILKLMDSQTELSNLEGLFLRVRLGNMEKGYAGTGYHVACIDGVQSEHVSRGSMFILPVNMGSVKTMVGSQSISNQEFLEDELTAWWSATVKNGKLPTQEELNDKLLQRNNLRL